MVSRADPRFPVRPSPSARLARLLCWAWRALWLAAVVFLITFWAISSAASRRLARELRDQRRSGELVAIEELIPRVPPGDRNAADAYRRAIGALHLSREQWKLLVGDGPSLWRTTAKSPSQWNAREAMLARAAVAANSRCLRLLDEASRIPACAFPVAWHRGHDTAPLHLPGMLAAGLMLRAQAFLLTRQDRGDEAMGTCATLLRIADHLQTEPALPSQHTGYRLQGLALAGVEEALGSTKVSPAVCQQLARQLVDIDLVPRSILGMQGETAIWGLPEFDLAWRSLPQQPRRLPRHRPWPARLTPAWVMTLDGLAYLHHARQSFRALELPWPAAQQVAGEADRELAQLSDYRGLLTKATRPAVLPELRYRQETMARIGAARIALEIRAYRLRIGRYPASLASAEAALGALPRDPFTEQPYRYRRRPVGFVVYSLGPDLTDNGGLPPPEATCQRLVADQLPDPRQQYDVALRCTAR